MSDVRVVYRNSLVLTTCLYYFFFYNLTSDIASTSSFVSSYTIFIFIHAIYILQCTLSIIVCLVLCHQFKHYFHFPFTALTIVNSQFFLFFFCSFVFSLFLQSHFLSVVYFLNNLFLIRIIYH